MSYDLLYILAILALVASLLINFWLKSVVSKWSQVEGGRNLTANDAVRKMLYANGMTNIAICHKSGELTDCYSPNENKIYLSDTTYDKTSVAAIAIAAHECGHAIQHEKGMLLYRIRQALVPAANLGSRFGVILAFVGFMLANMARNIQNHQFGITLMNIGIIAYFLVFLFYLVMVPVELDASRRGLLAIKNGGFVEEDNLKGTFVVLIAAGSTYVMALVSVGITLLRLLAMRDSRRR